MSGGWRFLLYRLNGDGTQTLVHPELPLVDARMTELLSAPTVLTAKLTPPVPPGWSADTGRPVLEPYASAIYVERDGVLRAGTIVTEVESGDGEAELVAVGFLGYLDGQGWTDADQLFYDTDPAVIYRWVWARAQGNAGGNLALTCTGLNTPLRVGKRAVAGDDKTSDEPVRFAPYATTDVGKALGDLAAEASIELRETHEWDGEQIRHVVEMAWPRRGRRHGTRWVIGENVTQVPELRNDSGAYASDVTVIGAGDGPAAIVGRASSATLTRLRRAVTISRTDLATKPAAESFATTQLRRRQPIRSGFESVTVRDSAHAPVASVAPGDDVNLTGGRFDAWVRVLSVETTAGQADVKWTVQPVQEEA